MHQPSFPIEIRIGGFAFQSIFLSKVGLLLSKQKQTAALLRAAALIFMKGFDSCCWLQNVPSLVFKNQQRADQDRHEQQKGDTGIHREPFAAGK